MDRTAVVPGERPFTSNDVSGPPGGSDSYYIYVNYSDCDSNTDSWNQAADNAYPDDSTIVASIDYTANSYYSYDSVSFRIKPTIHNQI